MSKVIEDAAQDFAAINDDKAANSAHSYSKYDIADAYQQGADFGYSLAENRIKKEYEEWHPLDTLTTPDVVVQVLYNDTEVTAYLTEITEELITSFGGLKLDKERIKGWRPVSFL